MKLIVIVSYICTGEFGVVYRGLLLSETKKIPEAVAVKTLKGRAVLHACIIIHQLLHEYIAQLSNSYFGLVLQLDRKLVRTNPMLHPEPYINCFVIACACVYD